MAAGGGEVHDLTENVEGAVGAARRGPAVAVEPLPDMARRNAVERLRPEGGKKLALQTAGCGSPVRGLVAGEVGVFSRARDEIPEKRDGVCRVDALPGLRVGLPHESLPAGLGGALRGDRAERDAFRAPAGAEQHHPAPSSRGPDPGTGHAAVPDVKMVEKAGFSVQPQPLSVRIAPPANRTRFLMYARPDYGDAGGKLHIAIGPKEFVGFFADLDEREVVEAMALSGSDWESAAGRGLDAILDRIKRFLTEKFPQRDTGGS